MVPNVNGFMNYDNFAVVPTSSGNSSDFNQCDNRAIGPYLESPYSTMSQPYTPCHSDFLQQNYNFTNYENNSQPPVTMIPTASPMQLQPFGYLPFAAHPQAHYPPENELEIPLPDYAPCQGPRPWNFSYCYGFYGEPACPLVNLVDMEDFM